MSDINNNASNTTIPGMLLPTQQGMIAGNPRDSAIAQGNAANLKLQALQSIGGRGRRLRKTRGGAADLIPVSQFNMQYTPQGGPGQTPNSIIQQNAVIGTQGAANAVYDKYATQMGGYYNNVNMNMNTNQYQWGCYSGGKKYRRASVKNSKRKRTKRRSVRRNKGGKSRKNKKA
jgi:hypothetical protein